MATNTSVLLREAQELIQKAQAARFSGTDVLLADGILPFNKWLQEVENSTNYFDTKPNEWTTFLFPFLSERGVVIDRVTGTYLLPGERDFRVTTIKDVNQLVFTLLLLHNTPLKHIRLNHQKTFSFHASQKTHYVHFTE